MAPSAIDYDFYQKISEHPKGRGITQCLGCGTCSATCQVMQVNPDYNPRKLIQKAVLGLKDEVLACDLLWICARCHACIEKCPKGIRPGDIIHALRHLALAEHPSGNRGMRHSRYFKKSILKSGKINEMILPLYTLRWRVASQMPQSIRMLIKGKLPPLVPAKIGGLEELKTLYHLIEGRRK